MSSLFLALQLSRNTESEENKLTIYYYPFESHETGDESNPYDRAITAEQERMFNKLRYGNGVFNPDSGSLQVTSNSNMTVTVGKGGCHIEGAIAYNDAPIILTIEAADATLNRIDRVVAQFNTSDSVRAINILVRTGTAAANPVPPEARTQSNLYELVLADIYVGKNASSISTANITDRRLSSELCGQVVPAIPTPLNLDDIYSQYQASLDEWLDTVAMALDGTLAGNLQNQISALGVRIDNLILSTGNSPIEVKDARLGYDGTAYSTLKERLDTENSELKSDLADLVNGSLTWINGYRHLNTGDFVTQESYRCTKNPIYSDSFDIVNDNGVFGVSTNSFISLWKNETYVGYYFTYNKKFYDTSKTMVDSIEFDSFYLCMWNTNDDYLTITIKKCIDYLLINRWYKKTSGFLGDSITYGAYTPVGTSGVNPTERAEKRYCEIAGEKLGFTVNNYGISGTSISRTSTVKPTQAMSIRYTEMIDDLDLICVMGGCNDYLTNVPIGTIADTTDISFYGALYVLCYGLIEKYPNSRIVFITPIHREPTAEVANSAGHTLEDYRQVIRDVARGLFGLKVIEGTELGANSILPIYRQYYIVDGTHPNPILHEIMGNNLAQELLSI